MSTGHIQFISNELVDIQVALTVPSWFSEQRASNQQYFQATHANSTGTAFEKVLVTIGGENIENWSDSDGVSYYEVDFPDGWNELFIPFLTHLVSLGMGIDGFLDGDNGGWSFFAEIDSEELIQASTREGYSWSDKRKVP